jgi:predicted ATPase
MPFIKSFTIDTEKQHPFPFNISAVRFAKDIALNKQVTIFVGDNGTGKSTLMESIALVLNLPLIGGYIKTTAGFEAAELLKPYLKITWGRETSKGFFFRAEDFSDFLNSVERQRQTISEQFRDLQGEVDDSIIRQMTETANYALHATRNTYGSDMQAFSHGEAYLKILYTRIQDKGVYMLDEPEAALSPLKQLSLIAFILEVLKTGNAQFIISTHSPILMGIPDATLYQIKDDGMEAVEYKDTDHYRITKTFLDRPDFYLRHFS